MKIAQNKLLDVIFFFLFFFALGRLVRDGFSKICMMFSYDAEKLHVISQYRH